MSIIPRVTYYERASSHPTSNGTNDRLPPAILFPLRNSSRNRSDSHFGNQTNLENLPLIATLFVAAQAVQVFVINVHHVVLRPCTYFCKRESNQSTIVHGVNSTLHGRERRCSRGPVGTTDARATGSESGYESMKFSRQIPSCILGRCRMKD